MARFDTCFAVLLALELAAAVAGSQPACPAGACRDEEEVAVLQTRASPMQKDEDTMKKLIEMSSQPSSSWPQSVLSAWARSPQLTARRNVAMELCHAIAAYGSVEDGGDIEIYKVPIVGVGTEATPEKISFDDDTNTLMRYEVASISKVFTVILAQVLINEGKIAWSDTLGSLLPLSGKYAPKDKKVLDITLEQLASHTSGLLETVPQNLHKGTPQGRINKFYGYTVDNMLSALSTQFLGYPLGGGKFFYCNWGFGILGWIMENVTGVPYEDLMQTKVLEPLGMENSFFGNICSNNMPEDDCKSLYLQSVVQGFDPTQCCNVTANRYEPYGVMKGQGSGLIPVRDMVMFLKACIKAMRYKDGHPALTHVMSRALLGTIAHVPIVPSDDFSHRGGESIGWQFYSDHGQQVIWKSGDSEGTSSIMLFNAQKGRYAFAASNCAGGMTNWIEMEWKPIQVVGVLLISGPPLQREVVKDLSIEQARFAGVYKNKKGFITDGLFDARQVTVVSKQKTLVLQEDTAGEKRFWKMNPVVGPRDAGLMYWESQPILFVLEPKTNATKALLNDTLKTLLPIEVQFGSDLPGAADMIISSDGWDAFYEKSGP